MLSWNLAIWFQVGGGGWGFHVEDIIMKLLEDVRIHSYALLVEGQYLVMQLLVTPTIRIIVSSVL